MPQDKHVDVLVLKLIDLLLQVLAEHVLVLFHQFVEFQGSHNITYPSGINLAIACAVLFNHVLEHDEKQLFEFLFFFLVKRLDECHELIAKSDELIISLKSNGGLLFATENITEESMALSHAESQYQKYQLHFFINCLIL